MGRFGGTDNDGKTHPHPEMRDRGTWGSGRGIGSRSWPADQESMRDLSTTVRRARSGDGQRDWLPIDAG
jgi:hypothetical protein